MITKEKGVSVTPTWGPLVKSVRLFYADLKDAKNSDQHFQNAIKLAERCYNPNKVPSPSRNEMMRMLNSTWNKLDINNVQAFKKLFVTNSLDGSQDYLVSDKLFSLIGESMRKITQRTCENQGSRNTQISCAIIDTSKGHTQKNFEGMELFDNEGLFELIPDEESDTDTDADSSDYENQARNNLEIPINTDATQNPVVHDMVSLVQISSNISAKKD